MEIDVVRKVQQTRGMIAHFPRLAAQSGTRDLGRNPKSTPSAILCNPWERKMLLLWLYALMFST